MCIVSAFIYTDLCATFYHVFKNKENKALAKQQYTASVYRATS